MDIHDLVTGTMELYNCCDSRAMQIVARHLNEHKEYELIGKIEHMHKTTSENGGKIDG